MKYFTCLIFALYTLSGAPSEAKTCKFGMSYMGPDSSSVILFNDIIATKPDYQRLVPEALGSVLEEQLSEALQHTNASAASVSLFSHKHGFWSSHTDSKNKPFWIASISKLVTAAIIMQLMEEKQLLAEDTIDRWFPSIPNSSLITIEQLLTHTSGLFNFNHVESVRIKQGYKPARELLDAAIQQGADFCPGTNWNYSNTGYLVLARIAEQLDNLPFAQIVHNRIANPLKLGSLRVASVNESEASLVTPKGGDLSHFSADIASILGAGSIVANTRDTLSLLAAFLRGDLVSLSSVEDSVKQFYPLFSENLWYGRGIMAFEVPDPESPSLWIGHSGGAPQGKALVVLDIKRNTYIAISLNTQAPAEAIAHHLLKALDLADSITTVD